MHPGKGLGLERHGNAGGDDHSGSRKEKAGRSQLGRVQLRGRIIAASPHEIAQRPLPCPCRLLRSRHLPLSYALSHKNIKGLLSVA